MAVRSEEELPVWRERLTRLEEEFEGLKSEESHLLEELAKIEEQMVYYDTLTHEMKRTLEPPRLSGLLGSLRRA